MCQGRTHRIEIIVIANAKQKIFICLASIIFLLSGCMQETDTTQVGNSSMDNGQLLSPIEDVNEPPVILSVPVTSINFDEAYIYPVLAIDADGDNLVWSLSTALEGMKIDPPSGLLYGSQISPGNHTVTVKVEDEKGGSAEQTFTLSSYVNPTIYSVSPNYIFTGHPYNYQVSAASPDEVTLLYTLESGPSGMSMVPETGSLSWNVPVSGEYNIAISVTSNSGNSTVQEYMLTVLDAESLRIISESETDAVVSQVYEYQISVLSLNATGITYTLINSLPGLTLDPAVGLLKWVPETAGSFTVAISATNAAGQTDTQSFEVEVHSLEDMDQMFNEIVHGGFSSLISGDISNTKLFLSVEAQSRYLPVLNELKPFMLEIVASMGALERMNITATSAEYLIPRTGEGDSRLFIVTFIRDAEGNWKLNSL
jgi:hypothetical protein